MLQRVIAAQRDAVIRLHSSGEISNDVMHRIERDLDLDELRLEGQGWLLT